IVATCEGCRGAGVAGQQSEERSQAIRVEAEGGRKLPEDRPQLVGKAEDTRRKEVRERRLDVCQPLHVGDEAPALDREEKVRGRLLVPGAIAVGMLERIERAVDLDGVEVARSV